MHKRVTPPGLILSLFPGIDLLGRAFEERGFCIVRGPDLITGGDIRNFTPPPGKFDGVIAGSPCQDYSGLNRNPGTYSDDMLQEFIRCIGQAKPHWFLFENVARAPRFKIQGYHQQRFELDLAWFSDWSRLRHFVYGNRNPRRLLDPQKGTAGEIRGTAVIGNDPRSFSACCEIQGLPRGFDLPDFHLAAKKQAIANGVPMPMGKYVADLILRDVYGHDKGRPVTIDRRRSRRCECGCGRIVAGRQQVYASTACRKRAQRARDAQAGISRG